MAKLSLKERDKKRRRMVASKDPKREALLAVARSRKASQEEIFKAMCELARLPRNSSKTRVRNRCLITGRSRGYYRKFGLSRIMLRELANRGEIPGIRKSSW